MNELASGDTIGDRYTVTEKVDTGGFSAVWRARDNEHDFDVALKVPSFHTNDPEVVLQRFAQEIDILEPFSEGLSHGTLVRYLDGDMDTDPPYIALEFLSGDPLVDKFGTGELGSGVRQRIVTDLAETLDFIHRNDIIYLDLKPENIVVRRSGRPVLMDFNTAVRGDESVSTRFEADQFKAPELLVEGTERGEVGPWTDVYSWGKLAFYLLTGTKVPTKNVPDEGLDPHDFGSSCSQPLAEVITQATRPDTEARYENGMALAADVAQATGRHPRRLLEHPESGVACTVGDGDTLGRLAEGALVPWVVLADSQHISPRHARFGCTFDGDWTLEDTSVNGTYVSNGKQWKFLLSEDGYRKQLQSGKLDADDPQPSTRVSLPERAIVAPVHPKYGLRLHVKPLPES